MTNKYLIKYQATPFARTSPSVILVEAPDRANAWAAAFDQLTRQGLSVDASDRNLSTTLTDAEAARVRDIGVPRIYGSVMFLELLDYKIRHAGSPVEGSPE